jgi:hypothetical protein
MSSRGSVLLRFFRPISLYESGIGHFKASQLFERKQFDKNRNISFGCGNEDQYMKVENLIPGFVIIVSGI